MEGREGPCCAREGEWYRERGNNRCKDVGGGGGDLPKPTELP